MSKGSFVASALLCLLAPALAQEGAYGGSAYVSISLNVPMYPDLVPVPDYPVYYAPQLDSNYFYYDGMYWDYQGDNWYASSWYNGPWQLVSPMDVPLFVLRVPVRYYRQPPAYFVGWQPDAPPRWGDHWGGDWAQHHRDWDQWDRHSAPAPAPLPSYQKQYSGGRYPDPDQQRMLQTRNSHYEPRDPVVHKLYEAQRTSPAPAAAQHEPQRAAPETRSASRDTERSPAPRTDHQGAVAGASPGVREQPPRERSENAPKAPAAHAPALTQGPAAERPQQLAAQRHPPAPTEHREAARPPVEHQAARPPVKAGPPEAQRAPAPREEKRPERPEERGQDHK